jgi:hypothetical protein
MSETDHRTEPHVSTEELRAALDAARGDAAELRSELATAKADLRERRGALEKLAAAGWLKRRKLIREFHTRGLI